MNNSKFNFKEMERNGVNWTQLVQDKDWWQALVKMVMNLQVPQMHGISCQLQRKESGSRS